MTANDFIANEPLIKRTKEIDKNPRKTMGEQNEKTICIIGAGIIGLSTAMRIIQDDSLKGMELT